MEIEFKLLLAPEHLGAVADHAAVRAVRSGSAQSALLHTRYYDTPARDLARAGVALRVRRGNDAWTQTLKAGGRSAGGLHERVELEWPLPDEHPDLALLASTPYAALFADERIGDALRPVFETEFERVALPLTFTDGTTAELAIDRGVVRAGTRTEPISELELELRQGDVHRLFELALALTATMPVRLGYLSKAERGDALAGGRAAAPRKAAAVTLQPSWTAMEALRHIVAECVVQMQANERGVLDSEDIEYLHQLRVASRRLRSCLGLLRFLAPKEDYAGLTDELRWLSGELGPARDWDVYIAETLPTLQAAVPAIERLGAVVEQLRAQHRGRARHAIASPRYAALLLQLAQRCHQDDFGLAPGSKKKRMPFDAQVGKLAREVLRKRHRRLSRHGEGLPAMRAEKRHAVRIEAKKLRYAAEFFGALYPAEATATYIAALRNLQDTLGVLNDAAQTERLVREAASAHAEPADAQVVADVAAWEAARVDRELQRYAERWRAFEEAARFWRRTD